MDDKYKWKLTDIYESDADWEQDYEQLKSMLPDLKALKDGFASSARALARCPDPH